MLVEWFDFMLLLWRLDKDGVELMFDMVFGDWLLLSFVNLEIDWLFFILLLFGFMVDWLFDWLLFWLVLFELFFNIFFWYFVFVFWNYIWKIYYYENVVLFELLLYWYFLNLKCMNMFVFIIYCIIYICMFC